MRFWARVRCVRAIDAIEKGQSVSVFDDHDGCVRDVYTDFDDGGRDKNFAFRFCGRIALRLLFLRWIKRPWSRP